jgi:hypothetical protein
MWEAVKVLLGVIIFLVVLEMLALPDWIGRKLRGEAAHSGDFVSKHREACA